MAKTKSVNFRLPETLANELQALSTLLECSQTELVKKLLEDEIQRHRAEIDQYQEGLKALQSRLK